MIIYLRPWNKNSQFIFNISQAWYDVNIAEAN